MNQSAGSQSAASDGGSGGELASSHQSGGGDQQSQGTASSSTLAPPNASRCSQGPNSGGGASSAFAQATGPPQRQSSIPIPNALLSTVNANKQRQPMCAECEKSLPNQIVFDKIESIIRKMQDEQTGLPVKTAKSFMTKIPSVFTGTDLIQWMMKNLKLEDQQEAIHLANLIASHGYIFPIEDHTLSIKNDCTFYRFQTPYLWPSNNIDPENTDYAVYLCKRTMQGKTRLELADYEAENLARLQKMFSRKWEFIFMQAESQAKVDKKRDKLERKVLDSQERAFWDVYRPVPGCVNTTELDIKKACRLSKSAKRCAECQKVATSAIGAGGQAGRPQQQHASLLNSSSGSVGVSSSVAKMAGGSLLATSSGQPLAPSPSPEVAQMKADYQVHRLSFKETTSTTTSSAKTSSSGNNNNSSSSGNKELTANDKRQRQPSEQNAVAPTPPPDSAQLPLDLKAIDETIETQAAASNAGHSTQGESSCACSRLEAHPAHRDGTTRPKANVSSQQTDKNPKDTNSEQQQQQQQQQRARQQQHKMSAGGEGEQEEQTGELHKQRKQSQSKQAAHSLHHHHHHHHQHSHSHPHHPHHHHHHHHHHHPHSHAHHAHHHHHLNRQCPHHASKQQQSSKIAADASESDGQVAAKSDQPAAAGAAGQEELAAAASTSKCRSSRCSLRSKQRSSGSVDQLMGPVAAGNSRRKSECNRMMSMFESTAAKTTAKPGESESVDEQKTATSKSVELVEEGEVKQLAGGEMKPRDQSKRPSSVCCSLASMNTGSNSSANQEDQQHQADRDKHRNQAATAAPDECPRAALDVSMNVGSTKSVLGMAGSNLKRKGSLNIVARPPSADQAMLTASTADRDNNSSSNNNNSLGVRKGSVATYGQHQRAQLKGAQSICGPAPSTGASSELQLVSGGVGSGLNRAGSIIERGHRLDVSQKPSGVGNSGGTTLASNVASSSSSFSTTAAGATSASNMNELERELESLRLRLDRGGVKMSKVTQSYLSYFNQWAEYDPFIVQPLPSNPWQSDSTELWDSERQTKDVHCRRVRRWAFSLKELLNDPAGREQFHRFLEKEFSAENLKFWDAVQELKRVHARDVARRVEAIWTEYLAQDANCPINIDSKSYETSKKNMAKNKNNRYIFDEAAGHVYQLMKNDSYPRYLRSDMYKDYKEASERRRPNQVAFDVFKPQITTLKHKFNF